MPGTPLPPLDFEGFTLDLSYGCLRRGLDEIKLRPKSFEVLRYLVENRGRLLSKEELMRAVWGHEFVTDNSLVQCLIEVRRALGDGDQTLAVRIQGGVQRTRLQGTCGHARAADRRTGPLCQPDRSLPRTRYAGDLRLEGHDYRPA